MKKQILHIAPAQAGKVFAVFYFLVSIPMIFVVGFTFSSGPEDQQVPLGFLVAIPFFYAIGGFIFTAFASWIYNLIARWVGGIEFTTIEKP